MAKIRITQVRSKINRPERQKRTLQALGLRKINQTVELEATPQVLGMVQKVSHLVKVEDNKLQVLMAENADGQLKMMWGTIASLIKNMVEGLSKGYEKNLEVNGVGFKVSLSGSKLNFALGFSHPVVFEIPKGIEAAVEKNTISIKGYDKQLVGQVASQIRALKKPEPYKGKGIKYVDEVIRRKAGKAAVGAE